MRVVESLLRSEKDGGLSFGNYTLSEKAKLSDFEFDGDVYKVKTYNEITKLEKNGLFVYESVPGSSVFNLKISESEVTFTVEGKDDVQITLELESETDYEVLIAGESTGTMKTNLGGKLVFSVETEGNDVDVRVVKR